VDGHHLPSLNHAAWYRHLLLSLRTPWHLVNRTVETGVCAAAYGRQLSWPPTARLKVKVNMHFAESSTRLDPDGRGGGLHIRRDFQPTAVDFKSLIHKRRERCARQSKWDQRGLESVLLYLENQLNCHMKEWNLSQKMISCDLILMVQVTSYPYACILSISTNS
jgi:hypothetical protein